MQKSILLAALVLAGCSHQPVTVILADPTRDATAQSTDIADCKQRAKDETDTPERIIGSFLAGLTIIGAPIAIAAARQKRDEAFQGCMKERGYADAVKG